MAIKVIFFDAAGTLIKPVRRVGESYALLAQRYGVEVSAPQITARFRSCFDAAPPLAFPGAPLAGLEDLERNWWRDLVQRVFEPFERFTDFDAYFAELFSYFARPDAWELYPEVGETLSTLKERGLMLGVISNFDSRLAVILDGLGAGPCFDQICISSRIGYAKPARHIFQAALDRHAVAASEAVHVGDSEENDYYGALHAGLKAILVDRGDGTGSNPPLTVGNLKDILQLMDDF